MKSLFALGLLLILVGCGGGSKYSVSSFTIESSNPALAAGGVTVCSNKATVLTYRFVTNAPLAQVQNWEVELLWADGSSTSGLVVRKSTNPSEAGVTKLTDGFRATLNVPIPTVPSGATKVRPNIFVTFSDGNVLLLGNPIALSSCPDPAP